jgi:hypothetical protein
MTTIGLAFSWLWPDTAREQVEELTHRTVLAASAGRLAAVFWTVPHEWKATSPVEGWITAAAMGGASKRDETKKDDVVFFGNLVIRTYGKDAINPERTIHAALFRKKGNPAYVRRKDPLAPIITDELDSHAYAFTRDIANNTWHICDSDAENLIVSRLARLACWSDEEILEVKIVGSDIRQHLRELPDHDLIGVAQKVEYSWAALNFCI